MKRWNKHWKGILLFLAPVAVLYFFYFIYPLGFVFVTSLTKWNGVSAPQFVGLQNYLSLFETPVFRSSVRNNLIWALSLGFIQIPLATLVAMILARRPAGWRVLRTVYFLPNVISQVAIAMMWMAIYNAEYGIINQILTGIGLESWTQNWLGNTTTALPAVIFQQVVYIGYFMIIVLASIMSIPDSFYEAATIDGASVFQQEWYITLPLIRGILLTVITLAVSYGLRHFEATWLMTQGGPANSTSVMGVMLYKKLSNLDYGEGNAIGAFLVIVGAILIALIQRLLGEREAAADAKQ